MNNDDGQVAGIDLGTLLPLTFTYTINEMSTQPNIFDEKAQIYTNKVKEHVSRFFQYISNISGEELVSKMEKTFNEGYFGYELYSDPYLDLSDNDFNTLLVIMKDKVRGTILEKKWLIRQSMYSLILVPKVTISSYHALYTNPNSFVVHYSTTNQIGMLERIEKLEKENANKEKRIRELEEKVEKMYYAPEMPGFIESKLDYEKTRQESEKREEKQ